MKLIIIIFLLVIISSQFILAQEYESTEFLNIYDKDSIYLYGNYLGKWYVKNGQIMPLGRFGKNLYNEMKGSKFAIEEMDKSASYAKIGTLTGFIAGTIGITGTILEIMDVEYSHKREVYISMVVSSAILGVVSKGFHKSSVGAMNRAVWLYNRDIVSKKMKE